MPPPLVILLCSSVLQVLVHPLCFPVGSLIIPSEELSFKLALCLSRLLLCSVNFGVRLLSLAVGLYFVHSFIMGTVGMGTVHGYV